VEHERHVEDAENQREQDHRHQDEVDDRSAILSLAPLVGAPGVSR
jgi:hypothetical protein